MEDGSSRTLKDLKLRDLCSPVQYRNTEMCPKKQTVFMKRGLIINR